MAQSISAEGTVFPARPGQPRSVAVGPKLGQPRADRPVRRTSSPVAHKEVLDSLATYVGFGPSDHRTLRALGPALAPFFSEIVEEFYEAIDRDPTAASVFTGPAQIDRLKKSMHQWLEGVFAGVYDDEYFERRARIGRVHVRVGLEQRFMFSAMNVLREGMHRSTRSLGLSSEEEVRAHRAIDRICDIELGVMLEVYREDYILRRTAQTETMAAMGKLTAGLAHEIRNPLNAAKLQLEVMKRGIAKGSTRAPSIQERVGIVTGELDRLSLLLDDFLSLARPRAVDATALDLAPLIAEVVGLQGPVAASNRVALRSVVPVDLPRVYADAKRIRQVLVNLLVNAVEASRGEEDSFIEVGARSGVRGMVEVVVEDNGVGLESDVEARVFESFVTTKDAGTGLGLTIVRNIIERHGGSIELGARPGGGAVARFTLPTA